MSRQSGIHIRTHMLPAKAFYLLYYGAAASLIPFLVIYYEQLGLSGRQIGVLTGVTPLVTLISAPLWGGAADAGNRHRTALTLATGGALAAALWLSTASSFLWLLPVVIIYAFFSAPIMPLVDNTVMTMLGDRKDDYGKQRVWGAIGWGVAAPLVGELTERAGLGWIFYIYVGLMFVALFTGRRLPLEQASARQPFWKGLSLMLAQSRLVVFLGTVLVGGAGLGLVSSYLFLFLQDMGASKTIMGLSLTVATLSELPILYFSNRLLARWGAHGLLALALLAFVVRAFAYSAVGAVWIVLLIQLLHGPSFSAMWVAGVSYADKLAPEGMGATAQGLFASVTMGLGSAAGGFFGGILYDAVGPIIMFRLAAGVVLVALLVLLASNRHAARVAPRQSESAI